MALTISMPTTFLASWRSAWEWGLNYKQIGDSELAPFRFHDLRYTCASRLAMLGANDRTIKSLGG
jgi:integrase